MTTTSRSQRFAALDGVRAIAGFAVVFSHVGFVTGRSLRSDWLGPVLSRGNFGVTLFFLLSGFLLYRPFALHSFGIGAGPALGHFYWRRAVRIFPALWLTVIVTLAVITPRKPLSDWMSYLLLVETYNHHDNDSHLTQLWTLGVEIAFYALLPILAGLVGGARRGSERVLRRQAILLGVLVLVTVMYNLAVSHHVLITHSQAALWLPNYLDWFAGGMALAVLSAVPAQTRTFAGMRRTLHAWSAHRGTCWLMAAVLFLMSTLPAGTPRDLAPATFWQATTQHYLHLGAAFFILLPLVLQPGGRVARVLGAPAATVLAGMSYSVYLWHPVLMLWLQERLDIPTFKGQFLTLLSLTFAATLAVATLSWYLLERPLLRYASRRRSTPVASAPATSAATHSS